jgi:2-hydroxychromene-2-carboxylate isomerase
MVEAQERKPLDSDLSNEVIATKSIEDQARDCLEEMTRLDRAYFGKDRLKQIKQKLE